MENLQRMASIRLTLNPMNRDFQALAGTRATYPDRTLIPPNISHVKWGVDDFAINEFI